LTRVENHVVSGLPSEDRIRLNSLCERCSLVISQVLSEVNNPTAHVYFPLDAVVSVMALTGESDTIGLALIGREGMLGSEVALGVFNHPIHVVVQGAGSALRMSIGEFRRELALNAALQSGMRRYIDVLMRQFSRSAACSHFHEIGPRLARWLLMSQDRSRSDSFHITHDFLARMLGVRRVGITAAAFELQRSGLIQYRRGNLVILDRAGLKASACSCYVSDLRSWSNRTSFNPPATSSP
jgi:CRP-like cAMP-binding protein